MSPLNVLEARTVPALLNARATVTPDAEALRFGNSTMSFAELQAQARAIASALRLKGVGAGDRVAIMVPNGLDFPVAWLAIPLLRAVAVPINVTYGERDLAFVLSHSGASTVLVGTGQLPLVEAARSSAPKVQHVLELADQSVFAGEEAESPAASLAPLEADPKEPVTIQYTSGTTGFPKGCVLHHGYWLRLARTLQAYAKLGPEDVLLTAQPQSYMDPSWNLVLSLLVGAPLVVLPRFSATTFWTDVARAGATFFYCIGTMPLYLLKQPSDPHVDHGHRVRLVYCSGIPPSLHAEMESRWACLWRETYGTTELGVVLATAPGDRASVGSGSMGQPVPGREITIAREGARDAVGDVAGELLVRGPDTMLRYHGDPASTAAWRSGEWAHTGDVVVDTGAGLALVGRTKDMIRRAGENIAAAEVESVLVEHPGVQAAACIAIADDLRGEEVKAYVQRTESAALTAPKLHAFVAERLAPFKVPRYIEFVDALPLTASEKIAKAELVASREDHAAGSWDAACE